MSDAYQPATFDAIRTILDELWPFYCELYWPYRKEVQTKTLKQDGHVLTIYESSHALSAQWNWLQIEELVKKLDEKLGRKVGEKNKRHTPEGVANIERIGRGSKNSRRN